MAKDVKVDALVDAAGGIDWEIDGVKAKQSKMEFPKGTGGAQLDFRLKDKGGFGPRFDRSSPIWVHENSAGQCPAPGASDPQISVVSCTDDVLTVMNSNERDCRLRYQLNFVDGNGPQPCDPEIRNGGR